MLSEDVKIRFAGFEPTAEVKRALYFVVNQLHLKSPSTSFLDATFTLTNGIFEGVIQVTSTAGDFVAKASDVHLSDVGHKLLEKLGSKLEAWKSLRVF